MYSLVLTIYKIISSSIKMVWFPSTRRYTGIESLDKTSFVERSSVEKEKESDVDGLTSHDEVRLNA